MRLENVEKGSSSVAIKEKNFDLHKSYASTVYFMQLSRTYLREANHFFSASFIIKTHTERVGHGIRRKIHLDREHVSSQLQTLQLPRYYNIPMDYYCFKSFIILYKLLSLQSVYRNLTTVIECVVNAFV